MRMSGRWNLAAIIVFALALSACGDSATEPTAVDDLEIGNAHVAVTGGVNINRGYLGEIYLFDSPGGAGDMGLSLFIAPPNPMGSMHGWADSSFHVNMVGGQGDIGPGTYELAGGHHNDLLHDGAAMGSLDYLLYLNFIDENWMVVFLNNTGTRLVIDEMNLPAPGGSGGFAAGRVILDMSGYDLRVQGSTESVTATGTNMTGTITFRVPIHRRPG